MDFDKVISLFRFGLVYVRGILRFRSCLNNDYSVILVKRGILIRFTLHTQTDVSVNLV